MSRLALLAFALVLAACSGGREAAVPDAPPPLPAPEETAPAVEDFEDFDAEPYRSAPAVVRTEVTHDVPARLLAGRAAAGTRRSAQGFRIQIANVPDKEAADAQVEAAIRWYRDQRAAGRSGGLFADPEAPVYTLFRQPYYRVRLGDFATRAAADRALDAVAARFPGALVVPDTVTLAD